MFFFFLFFSKIDFTYCWLLTHVQGAIVSFPDNVDVHLMQVINENTANILQ